MRRLACSLVALMMGSAQLQALDRPRDQVQSPSADETRSALPWLTFDSLSATRERPLFTPTRRRPAPPPAKAVAPSPSGLASKAQTQQQTPQLQLTGIVVSPQETIVLLRDPLTAQSVAIHPGDSVGRWRVFVDSNYAVRLSDGAKEFKLEMFTEPGARLRALP